MYIEVVVGVGGYRTQRHSARTLKAWAQERGGGGNLGV